jgi:hypothetical protein
MKKPKSPWQNGDYLLYVPYTTVEELKDKVYAIFQDMESEADRRHCFTEADAQCEALDITW